MAEVLLSKWFPHLRLEIRGVDDPVMEQALNRAAIEFCAKSEFIRYDHPAIKIAPFSREYQLTPGSANMQFHSILEVKHDKVDRPLKMISEERLDEYEPDWRDGKADLPEWCVRAEKGSDWYLRPVPFTETHTATGVITDITQGDPAVVTSAAHGRTTNDRLHFKDIVGMTQLNDTDAVINVLTTDTYELTGVDATQFSTYVSGGNWYKGDNQLEVIRLSTKPIRGGKYADQQLFDHYFEAVMAKAHAILLRSKAKKTPADLNAARELEMHFKDGWKAARIERKRGSSDRDGRYRAAPRRTLRKGPPMGRVASSRFDTEDIW